MKRLDNLRKLVRLAPRVLKQGFCIALLCVPCLAGIVDVSPGASSFPVVVRHEGKVAGFLSSDSIPDSVNLLPPPPAEGSAASAADEAAYRTARGLRGTPRWNQAAKDAELSFPEAAEQFSCALGVQVSVKATPHLYKLLLRTKSDVSRATRAAKKHYRRLRPFIVHKETSCTPADEPFLRYSGSYPSAHAATGWAWALILAEIDPDRADAILRRGLAFGQSRVVCGVHWQSDVEAGRTVAAGVVARLHADPVFRAEVAAAAAELAAARAGKLEPVRDCAAEAAALAESP